MTTALENREETNRKYGQVDLLTWFTERVSFKPPMEALDVGCGTGGHIKRLAQLYPETRFFGADISTSSIERAREDCSALENAAFEAGDAAGPIFPGRSFDLIFSIYAFYYIPEPSRVLHSLKDRLKASPSAGMALMSPYRGNNADWYAFLGQFLKIPDEITWVSDSFSDEIVLPFARQHFQDTQTHIFENSITVPGLDALRTYWRSNIYHKAELDDDFEKAARDYFSRNETMEINKRAILVRMAGPLK